MKSVAKSVVFFSTDILSLRDGIQARLPSNLKYSTGISVCIWVLKRCQTSDDVLLINASESYENAKINLNQNTLVASLTGCIKLVV